MNRAPRTVCGPPTEMPRRRKDSNAAAGARRIWVMMDHTTKTGESRLVHRCSYPLTALACVKRVYTNLAILDVTEEGFAVREMVDGMTLDDLQKVTDAPLRMAKM